MELLARFATQKWRVVLAATTLFSIFAWQRFRALPIEAFPDVTNPMVEVVGLYPGQAAEEVERRVTVELERVLAGTPHLIDLRSVSVFGLALVTLTFEETISDFELRAMVAARLNDATLPTGASTQMGPQATPVGQIYRYTLNGPRSLRELRALQEFVVERRLRAVPGVADVVTFGGFQRQYQVRIDPSRLAAYEVSIDEVYDALAHSNANAGGGYVRVGSQELVVRGLGAIEDPHSLGHAVVRSDHQVPIRVEDVAEIVEGSTPRRGAVGRGENDEVVEGIVLLRRGENPSVVLAALHARIAQLNQDVLPDDVQIHTFYDRTNLVNATLTTVGKNMLEGVLLVLAVVYVFLRTWRAVWIIAVVIPISLLSAFVGLSWLGLPANLISLGAIDFGILVDGAIIVVESLLHIMERREPTDSDHASRVQRATTLVGKPVAFSMLIIIVALGPIFALERVEGRIFAPMAYTYAFALLGALVSALLIVPALATPLFAGDVHPQEPRWLVFCGEVYERLLTLLRRFRGTVVAAFLALLLALIFFCRGIGSEFLPELNEGGFYITAVFPSTISLEETQGQVREIRSRVLRTPEVVDVLSHLGRPENATQAEGPNNAEFFITLKASDAWRSGTNRRTLEVELRQRLEEIPGVQYNFSQPITDRVFETISGIIGQVVVKVRGSDLAQMTTIANDVRQRLAHVHGVTDLALYQAGVVPSLRIDLDREALARRDLSVEDVQQTIRIALGGEVATEIWQGEQRFAVALRLPDEVRANPEALARVPVGPAALRATLGEVAVISTSTGRSSIWREDFSRFVAVKFNVRGRDLGSTVDAAKAAMHGLEMPQGTYMTWGGEFQNQARAMQRLGFTLPIALMVIVTILFLNFRRWRPTLWIVAFLPVAVLGALTGLRALGENFSVSSAVGAIALLGQVVLAGVTICARIDAAKERGAADPMLEGAREALRPVLLTTALALLGLLPAATSHAMGSETQRPFAIAIVGGLFVVAPAILLLLPIAYSTPWTWPQFPVRAQVSSIFGIAFLSMVLSAPSLAEAQESLEARFTLQDAESLLQRAHPEMLSRQADVAAADHDAARAGLWTNPQVSLDYIQGMGMNSYDPVGVVIAGIAQFVELTDVPGARRTAALEQRRALEYVRDGVALRRALALKRAFIALAIHAQIVQVQEHHLLRFAEIERIALARLNAGTLSGFALRRIALARAEAEAELAETRAEYAERRGELDVVLGPYARELRGRPEPFQEPLPVLQPLTSLLVVARMRRNDLLVLRAQRQSAVSEIAVAERSVLPGINVRVLGGYGQAPGQWDLGASVAIPLPVLDTGSRAIDAARARAESATQRENALLARIDETVRATYAATTTRTAAYNAFVAATQDAERELQVQVEAQFREGRLSVLELIDGVETRTRILMRSFELYRLAWLSTLMLQQVVELGD